MPAFDNVIIRKNTADNRDGCGMYFADAAAGEIIINSTIDGISAGDENTCDTNSGEDGGIYYTRVTTGTLSITDANILYNYAEN